MRAVTGSRPSAQQEAPGAVGDLVSPAGAGLTEEGGLLVAGDPGDRDGARRTAPRGLAEDAGAAATSGSTARGKPETAGELLVPVALWMSNSSVREALRASVRCLRRGSAARSARSPPCRRPGRRPRPRRARRGRCRGSSAAWSRRSRGPAARPVARAPRASPARRSASQLSAVRRSCQTMAVAARAPVARSQTMVVSRWLVMPMAATRSSPAPSEPRPAFASTSCAVSRCVAQISPASCSTHPGCGKCWVSSRCAEATMRPSASTSTARELVVPWSSARMRRSSRMLVVYVARRAGPALTASAYYHGYAPHGKRRSDARE